MNYNEFHNKFNLRTFRRHIATSSELHKINISCIYIYMITSYYITNGKNLKRIVFKARKASRYNNKASEIKKAKDKIIAVVSICTAF